MLKCLRNSQLGLLLFTGMDIIISIATALGFMGVTSQPPMIFFISMILLAIATTITFVAAAKAANHIWSPPLPSGPLID